MEASAPPWLLYVSLASCILLYKLFLSTKKPRSSVVTRRPPGPAPLPLLGNILQLHGEPHHALARLADAHGPVMSLRLGAAGDAVVVSSAAAARDALQRHDHVLAGRSVSDAARALGNHDRSVIWLPATSPLWRRLRAACTKRLFSARGLDATRAVREGKVRELVESLRVRAHAGEAVHVGRAVFGCAISIVSDVLFSDDAADLSSGRAQELETLLRDALEEVTKPNVSDLFPVLARLDLQGRRRRTAELLGRLYDLFDPIIARRLQQATGGGEKNGDFLDVLLQLHATDQLSIQTIKSFLLDLFVGGTETNAIAVEWTMAELLRNPAVMSKVRAELRDAMGSKPHPDESDIARLPYLRAVVMESMRLHPPGPLMVPHLAMADGAEVGGFAVPRGTKVIINLWAIMRDPALWPDPVAFVPERFAGTSDADFRGKDRLEFMPFGAGRRACPGSPMATRVVMLVLASMLHAFEWRLPEGMQPEDVDVRDRFVTSLNMVTPLRAVPSPLNP
ncbi:hypothetical protein BS78_02G199400 [Paspalum vaginatum]|nr:hypothetical protein BS78_02G199400 [Paspalum vaginatum]